MTVRHVELRPGTYRDSVRLMQVSDDLRRVPGVAAALVAMATPLNVDLAAGMGFPRPDGAAPDDLLVAVTAADEATMSAALGALADLLAEPAATAGAARSSGVEPRTVASAVRRAGANLALISTPGRYAFLDAVDALDAGASVMLFSDNVPQAQEVRLKQVAAERGRLVLGPDCGTAVIGGVGLGFANVVRPGPVGLVAASGTGAQQVMSLLDAAGVGVSQCLGVGGRDLSEAVGGRSTVAALDALDADEATELIVLISKPPAGAVAEAVREHAARLRTPVVFALLGPCGSDLTAASEEVLRRLGRPVPRWPEWAPQRPARPRAAGLRGLFAGGTLCGEALEIAAAGLGKVDSNLTGSPHWTFAGGAHVLLDLGADELTEGRPHPMIDGSGRLERLAAEVRDASCGVVLLDVVLGHGAQPDPAGALAPALAAARDAGVAAVVSLVGTAGDPQGLVAQARALSAAGAAVFASNAQAARHAVRLAGGHPPQATTGAPPAASTAGGHAPVGAYPAGDGRRPALAGLMSAEPSVVTAGVDLLAEALAAQAVEPLAVSWRPPPDAVLDSLARVAADPRRRGANDEAVRRMLAAGALLVDVRPAAGVLGLSAGQFCHAGPPIDWHRAAGPLRGALIGAVLLEGLATDPAGAERLLESGSGVELMPCHALGGVGPMAGVVSPSMWVAVLRDEAHDRTSWCTLNEGLGAVLRYGAYGPEVLDRLRWMGAVLGPALRDAIRARGPVDVKAIVGQMVQMGDEGHNRNRAGTLMLLRDLLPHLVESGLAARDVAAVARFIGGNDHFFLNLVMPACKLATAAAAGIPGCTVVTAMARNGTDFGIQVSGTGDAWFTGPAAVPEGLFLGGYGPADANPDIGDSAITETAGLGGFAMAGAPAIVRFVGGSVPDAMRTTQEMYEITLAENPAYALPVLDFRGAPTGIDATRVLRTGILPQINTGIAGRVAGTGQVGAGLVKPPRECFLAAVEALADAAPAAPA